MIPVLIDISINSPDLSQTGMRRMMKLVNAFIAGAWYKRILPKHFSKTGSAEYRYKPRSKAYFARVRNKTIRVPSYAERKIKATGKNEPLDWKGDMERQIMGWRRVTSTSRGGKVSMRAPQYLNAHKRAGSNQPDKADEITRVSDRDIRILTRMADQWLQQWAKTNTTRQKITTRAA